MVDAAAASIEHNNTKDIHQEEEKLGNICWYATEGEENPFPSYLIETEDYKLNNLDFIAKLKEIITN